MSIIGIDAKEYHSGHGGRFFSSIGLGVETYALDTFNKQYASALNEAFHTLGIEQSRAVYDSATISKKLGEDLTEFYEIFIEGIRPIVINLYFFFTIISPKKVAFIYSQGKDRKIPPGVFMQKNIQSYSYWAAWRHWKRFHGKNTTYLLDNFQGEDTAAWREFRPRKPAIYFRGDVCNALISTADILLSFFDKQLRIRHLDDKSIKAIIKESGFSGISLFIGQPHFSKITPQSRTMINTNRYIKHPIFFIINEKRPAYIKSKEWTKHKEYTAVMDATVNAAFSTNGSLKWYDPSSDFSIIKPNDRLIYYGAVGKEIAEAVGPSEGVRKIYHFPYDTIK